MSRVPDRFTLQSIKRLEPYLQTKGLIELIINRPREVVLETQQGFQTKAAPELTIDYLETMAGALATYSGQKFDDEHPILACSLPYPYGHRVQIVGKAVVQSGFAMAIRVAAAEVFDLSAWFSPADVDRVIATILDQKNILVAGGTSSGKTTLMNSMLQHVPKDERILTIEDALELVVPHHNSARMLKSRSGSDIARVSYQNLIDSVVRQRPDRIFVGELSIENTMAFLRVVKTGHPGSMSTVHADTADGTLDALMMNLALAGYGGNGAESYMMELIKSAVQVIIHVTRVSRREFKAVIKEVER